MSFKKYFLLVSVVAVLANASCEDNKKASEVKTETVKETTQSSIDPSETSEEKKEEISKKYPLISNENVVEFLTAYGNDNPETKVLITTQQPAIWPRYLT